MIGSKLPCSKGVLLANARLGCIVAVGLQRRRHHLVASPMAKSGVYHVEGGNGQQADQ
eukprot:CAMPEP_0119411438 /NCGR_PEP_ID=MMETSP1335-20130426/4187_1 /TAXON_ID=259385 /ORGANISM="Chrysoculter rhomboideus, Strain RCC1486" /LENGTH=57 /DNA_ID=CAMNT_0007436079 /DNA_START=188 /DNA_END=361 /DNA_ORIENTATION=-